MAILVDDITKMPQTDVVLTVGFFDGVHKGHRFLLKHLKKLAQEKGMQPVPLTFWPHPRIVLNQSYQPALLNTLSEKKSCFNSFWEGIYLMIPFTRELAEMSAYDFMKMLAEKAHVKHLVIGHDHRFGHNRTEGFEDYIRYGKELGMEVSQAPKFEMNGQAISSSFIRKLLNTGSVGEAETCLGYTYGISGTVVHGKEIGRTMGFPTANIEAEATKCIPGEGVYAVKVIIDQKTHDGVACIGTRPTFEKDGKPSIEVHIIDFSGNLYDKRLRVLFIDKIRDPKKFDTAEALSDAIKADISKAKKILQYY